MVDLSNMFNTMELLLYMSTSLQWGAKDGGGAICTMSSHTNNTINRFWFHTINDWYLKLWFNLITLKIKTMLDFLIGVDYGYSNL
jgi:hypothetical protein